MRTSGGGLLRIVVAAPKKQAIIKTIPNTLEAITAEISGPLELIRLDGLRPRGIHCYINENGKLTNPPLAPNLAIPGDTVVGNIVASKSNTEGEEVGLTEREAKFTCIYLNALRGLS
jgi:hypothetical protein